MKNPVAEFREENSLTQEQLANYAGVTRQVVTKVEAGLFDYIPPSIMNVITAYRGAEGLASEREYIQWIDQEVKALDKGIFPPVGKEAMYTPIPIKTFIDWRYHISESVNGFCTLLKIQPIIISNYEKGKTQNLPEILKTRLRTAGLSEVYILELERLPRHG
jgi:DNA-binding XRE family transcriptional regulator